MFSTILKTFEMMLPSLNSLQTYTYTLMYIYDIVSTHSADAQNIEYPCFH